MEDNVNAAGHDHQLNADGAPPDHPPTPADAPADVIADDAQHPAAINGEGPTAPPPATSARDGAPTHAVAAVTSAVPAYFTSDSHGAGSGIAPGDGDLMPPRFSGDGPMDADDWAKDLKNYVRIRRVTPEFASMLLENRLTGTARQWLENQPDNIGFEDIMKRFTRRFGMNEGARNQLLATFWTRKQGKGEPVRQYLEYMQGLARKLRLGTDSMMVQGIIQGLLPEVQRDVILQHPSTMEALTEAAAIGERNAKLMTQIDVQAPKDAAYYEARINRLEATIETMQQLMASDRKTVATVNAVGGQSAPSVPTLQQPQAYNGGGIAPGPTSFRTRGRGRGYRGTGGTWTARPPMGNCPSMGPYNRPPAPRPPTPTQQQADSYAGRQGAMGAAPPAPQQDVAAPTPQQQTNRPIWCGNCGRNHSPGQCRVTGLTCWNCACVGHVQSRCPYLNTPPPPSEH